MIEELSRRLGNLEGKMDLIILELQKSSKDDDEIESRLSALENFKNWAVGIATGIGAVAGAITAKASELMHSHH